VSIETDQELKALQRVGRVVAMTLDAMRRGVKAGVTTGELDDIAATVLASAGARSAPQIVYDFPGVTCISVNDEVVHGIPGSRALEPGDLVTLDVTAELEGYYADAAITVAVEPASSLGLRLAACAKAALGRAMEVARAGAKLSAVGAAIEREAGRQGFRVFRELCGHGIGRTIHEEPSVLNHYDPRVATRLTEGLVITIEPIITTGSGRTSVARDQWTVWKS
jgi:methionyl aminopeptidase